MLRDFSFLRRNSVKNPSGEEAENVPTYPEDSLNPKISLDSSRPALTAIQDLSQVPKCISDQEMSGIKANRVDRTPTKPKSALLRTPEKQGLTSKNHRFGWAQKSEHQSSNGVVESKEEGKVVANMNTPTRSTRGVGRANATYSDCNSTQNTPSKSVSKPPNPGFCLASGSRPPFNRMANFAALSKGIPSSCSSPAVVNIVEVPYFELKEDSSFWMDHNVQVLIRVRPLNNMEKSNFGLSRCLKQESSHCITWVGQPETRFTFDHVACEAIDQETLFRMVGLPMVENCLSGYNSCMFAYGQTGSGKTHTMLGEIEELAVKPNPNRGMTPRIFEFLFARIREEEECRKDERLKYNCKCSFLEIYNEQITDLLAPSSTNLNLREPMKNGVHVENLSEFEVHTVRDVLHHLSLGSSNRRVAATNMNRESSRSHSVFTCVIKSSWEKDSTTNFRFSRLNLVDLAGTERQKSSGAEGERLKEAANINKSLSTLGLVIRVLQDVANGKPNHVPYRDSRLTFLLQDSLGGNSKTIIIANVSPSVSSAADTLNTLKFAQGAKLIQNNAIINEDSSGDVSALKLQIRLLKEELSLLKREKVNRSLLFGPTIHGDIRNGDERKLEHDNPVNVLQKESNGALRVSCKQLKSLETTLAGAFRREQMAETSIKQLEDENEQLNRLVSQREEDTRCTKMMLKFREDKIQRMESLLGGSISTDDYLMKENTALSEEIKLLRDKIDKNPEVTRFANENIKLLAQVRRFQDFYEEGEREMLIAEVSKLRNQLIFFLDANSKHPNHLDIKSPNLRSDENDLICEELKMTISELEESKAKLVSCLGDNEKLRRELEELHTSNTIAFATQEHDCSAKVIKEFIVEVPLSNNQPLAAKCRDHEETRRGNLMEHAEEIMDLQLELDILKIILQEERSYRAETDEKAQYLNRELRLSNEMIVSATKEYEKVQEELKDAKLVIEALESQQILLINEIEDLRSSNIQYEELKNNKEREISPLKEQEFRDISLSRYSEYEDSRLDAKLRKMHESLEKAKKLNQWYQSGLSCRVSDEEELEEVRKQVEAETAEVIVCLQEELSVLQQEVHDSKMKEVETKDSLYLLRTEMKILQNDLNLKSEENAKLAEMLQERETELKKISEEWEIMGGEMEVILAGGHEALKEAHDQIDQIATSIPDKSSRILEQFDRMKEYVVEKEIAVEKLNQCLQNATGRTNDVESMLRSLGGAALVITEMHQQECSEKDKEILLLTSQLDDMTSTVARLESIIKYGKDHLRRASSCATAALVTVSRLSELNSNYEDALSEKNLQLREFQEIITQNDNLLHNQASIIDETHIKVHSLQMELDSSEECCTELKLQLSDERKKLEALRVMLEETENDKMLETTEKLKELNSGVSALKSCMDEYLMQGGDPHKDAVSASDACEPWIGTGTEHDIKCVESGNLEDVKTETSKYVASESSLTSKNNRETTIVLLKKEVESALRSLQGVQSQMAKLQSEKEDILVSEKHSKRSIESLMNHVFLLQETVDDFEIKFQLKVDALDGKLGKMEKIACTSWLQQKELFEAELDDAKVVASQKTIEASCVLEKFEEVQDTMKEADIMINELLIANESLKLNARELKGRESYLISEKDNLVNEIEGLKFSNNLKDQNYEKLEKQYEAEFVIMKMKLGELEAVVSEIYTSSMEEWLSLSSDIRSVKSQLNESTKSIRSLLEEVWSEIIVKDCAVYVLHLCHMGILLETANGLNAENGLLHHGLCESNAIISELREHNFRSKSELEMCRVLKGKLLADIKKSFDRISSKVDEAGELTLQLTFFEKKIHDLEFQEEMLLQKSIDMGSELVVLMKELDCSNRQELASLVDQDRLLKDKDEPFENREEYLYMELIAKELESLFLSSEVKRMSSTCMNFLRVLEIYKKDMIFKSLDASINELILKELVETNKTLTGSFEDVMEEKGILSCRAQYLESQSKKLLEESKMTKTALETSSRRISELDQNTQKLQDDICLLESELHCLQMSLAKKDKELGKMKFLEKVNEILEDQFIEHKTECCVLLQVLEGTKSDFEVENHRLKDNISVLENYVVKLEEDLHQTRVKMENYQLSQSVENDLCVRIQDLGMQLEIVDSMKKDNIFLRNELDAHKICELEYLNALSLKSSNTVNLAKDVEIISSKVLNLITQRFIEIDDMFQKTVKEVEKAHVILEQFNDLENLALQLDSEVLSIQMELSRKDDIVKGLLFDLSLLQESASNSKDQKDEMEELQTSFWALNKDFEIKSLNLDNAVAQSQILEAQMQDKKVRISALELEIAKQQEILSSLSSKNCELLSSANDALEAKSAMEKELIDTTIKCENLEIEIAEMGSALAQMSETNDSLKNNLDTVTSQVENLDGKVHFLTKELEMARALAEENEAIAVEVQEIAELSKVHAEEKEEEVKLLERSIEELEFTINVLEQKVDIVKGEAERQRLEREELELELHAVKEQMHNVKSNDSDIKRLLDEKEKNLQEALQRVQLLEREIVARDDEISRCKAHISELNFHAEAQACEYKQKFKSLEAMVEQVKSEVPAVHSANSSPSKLERKHLKARGSGSPFKCIGLGFQQIKSERDEELSVGRQRIEELEALASSRHKEILTLKARLASTESMTHDVIRDLLGVKLNMSSYSTLMDNQQLQSLMEETQHHNTEAKEKEVVDLKMQINEFIKERNVWLEEIERKQAELMAARLALEKLHQQDQFLATENDMLKSENANHKKRLMELQTEVKKLSGQQNIQHRIHHHAKTKDENNLLRNQNEDLSNKLQKMDAVVSRFKEELAQLRAENGRNPYINFDKELQLDKMLKVVAQHKEHERFISETEEERLQLAQKLLGLCTTVLQAAGMTRPSSEVNLSVAEEALHKLKNRVVSLEMELQDVKLKNQISEERTRLLELRPQTSTSASRADENCQTRSRLSPTPFLSAFDR